MKFRGSFLARQALSRLAGRFTLDHPFDERQQVVKAYDHWCGSLVALKRGCSEQLVREWERLKQATGRGVLQPKALLPSVDVLVFPWSRSGNLASLIAADRIRLPQGLALLRQIGEVVARCHRQGFIHGDIKPANIMCSSGGVLIDFTYATDIGIAVSKVIPCYASPAFASPAILRNQGMMRESCDWFSLAVSLELLVRRQHPFSGKTILDIPAHTRITGGHCFNWQACSRGHEITYAEFMDVLDCLCREAVHCAETRQIEDGSSPSAGVGRE